MRLKIDLDAETTRRLVEVAVRERRPIPWQAEVLLRRALGLPVPFSIEEITMNNWVDWKDVAASLIAKHRDAAEGLVRHFVECAWREMERDTAKFDEFPKGCVSGLIDGYMGAAREAGATLLGWDIDRSVPWSLDDSYGEAATRVMGQDYQEWLAERRGE